MTARHALMRAAAAAALLAGAPALAETTFGLHLVSRHAESGKSAPGAQGWNNSNPGFYVRTAAGFTAGMFRNSLNRTTAYAGHTIGNDYALTIGLANGYDRVTSGQGTHRAVRCAQTCRTVNLKEATTLLLVPSVRLRLDRQAAVRLSALLPPGQPAAVHLSVEWRLP